MYRRAQYQINVVWHQWFCSRSLYQIDANMQLFYVEWSSLLSYSFHTEHLEIFSISFSLFHIHIKFLMNTSINHVTKSCSGIMWWHRELREHFFWSLDLFQSSSEILKEEISRLQIAAHHIWTLFVWPFFLLIWKFSQIHERMKMRLKIWFWLEC